ncbi:hypothetical protein BC828DRAFT_414481 [Blastocladiella britannica]|nr:hypothetical protein BC828DRAFT_414481 [Blastocladiella britannica]
MLDLPSTPGFNSITDAFFLPPSFSMHTPPPSTKPGYDENALMTAAAWPASVIAPPPIQWHFPYAHQQWIDSPSPAPAPPPSTMMMMHQPQQAMLPLMGMDLGDAARLSAGPLAAGSSLTLWPQIIETSPAPSLLMMAPPVSVSMPVPSGTLVSSCSPPPPSLLQGNKTGRRTTGGIPASRGAATTDSDDSTKRAEVAQKARRVRQKTTAYINELEDTCIALKHECDQIRAEIALLTARRDGGPAPPPPPCAGCVEHAAAVRQEDLARAWRLEY